MEQKIGGVDKMAEGIGMGEPHKDGIKIDIPEAIIYVGWIYDILDDGYRAMALHIHFLPDTSRIQKLIYDRLKPYLDYLMQRVSFEKFKQGGYRENDDGYGCFLGCIALNCNHERIVELLDGIKSGAEDVLKQRLKEFLEEIFKAEE